MKRLVIIIGSLLLIAVIGTLLLVYIYNNKTVKVVSDSMSPTIRSGDTVQIKAGAYLFSKPERNDIVMFQVPENLKKQFDNNDKYWLSRVIGLPGETIEIKGGKVFIDGKQRVESFIVYQSDEDFGPIKVPSENFFLLCDNRQNCADGRIFNPPTIHGDYLAAKVVGIQKKQ